MASWHASTSGAEQLVVAATYRISYFAILIYDGAAASDDYRGVLAGDMEEQTGGVQCGRRWRASPINHGRPDVSTESLVTLSRE